jgi:hypothetical protein
VSGTFNCISLRLLFLLPVVRAQKTRPQSTKNQQDTSHRQDLVYTMASCEAQLNTTPVPQGRAPGSLAESAGLPAGFPKTVDSAMAWTGSQFVCGDEYILHLTKDDIAEAEGALKSFKGTYCTPTARPRLTREALGLDGDLVTRDNFHLPVLGAKLDQVRYQVHMGRGFGVIRGLDPQNYTLEDLTMLHLGLQTYVADQQGRQDKEGNMLGELSWIHLVIKWCRVLTCSSPHCCRQQLCAVGRSPPAFDLSHRRAPFPQSHHEGNADMRMQTFHNEEAGDVVSWLTKSTAVTGGKCIIASCYTVYQILAKDRPDLVRALAGSDWPFAL